MPDLIDILESFNRKERFFLVGEALGNPDFVLSSGFREKLAKAICLDEVPAGAFAWMDYHLDWLHASLVLSRNIQEEVFDFPNTGDAIKGTQEDIDLLVAFRQGDQYHLILVEAKAYTGWSNDQLKSKANRLREIFGDNGEDYGGVKPHFCLMGPKSTNIKTEAFPEWMMPGGELLWIDLKLPNGRRQVNRCDKVGDSYQRFRITGG